MTALRARAPRLRGDLLAVALAAALVVAAALVGRSLVGRGVDVLVDWPPLLAEWMPRFGPGTVPAVLVALLVVLAGPGIARRSRWGPLLGLAYAAALASTTALATIDGWAVGVAERLATPTEYLAEIPVQGGVREFLATFADRIPSFRPDALVTHAAGHPPGATLFYELLDRLGLGGGSWAGAVTMAVGASAVVPVALTLAAVADADVARRYLPFGVLFPGAVWVGVSADGMFAAVFAWGVAFLALGAVRPCWRGAALSLLGGVVLGTSLFLSYGLAAAGLVPLAVAVLARRVVPLVWAAVGVAVVVAVVAGAGFWWFDGYQLVQVRYYQPGEYGLRRPYGYWVWANLAALVVALGPAVVAGVRRTGWWALSRSWRGRPGPQWWGRTHTAVVLLAGAALAAVLVADLSGLSKAEVERIWLPFAVWLVPTATLLPPATTRPWLASQAVVALMVGSLLATVW